MSEGTFNISVPPGSTGSVVFAGGPRSKVWVTVPDIIAGFEMLGVCNRCDGPVNTGRWVRLSDLPLARSGSWRHGGCGGTGRMPDEFEVADQKTRETIDAYKPSPREAIAVSAVTLAELLRLSQAARAVQAGRPGSEERFERVLAEAPEPIRQLGDRWSREQKLSLAGVIIALVAMLMPLLKDDGGVTEEQLVEIVEQLIDHQSEGSGQQTQPEDGAAGSAGEAGAGESRSAAGAPRGGGHGGAPKLNHEQGVGDPDQ